MKRDLTISHMRKKRGLTQNDISKTLGIHQSKISHLENGYEPKMSHEQIIALEKIFDMSYDVLLTDYETYIIGKAQNG